MSAIRASTLKLGQGLEIGLAVITGIGGDERIVAEHGLHGLNYGNQQFLLGSGAMGLRLDDDLVPVIDRRYTRVALDHALRSRHFCTVVVGAVALAYAAFRSAPVVGMAVKPAANLRRITL